MQRIKQFFLPLPIDSQSLRVAGVGISETMHPVIVNRPNGMGDYLLMAFMDHVTIQANHVYCQCAPGTMVIWTPSHGHYYGNPEASFSHSWIHCDGAAIDQLIAESGLPLNLPFQLTDPAVVNEYLWSIYREVTGHSIPNERIVINFLQNWLLDMKRQISEARTQAPDALLALRQFLGENVGQTFTLADLAAQVNMSPSHLSAQFKRYFGVAPIEYHIQLRLHAAAYLLRDGNRAVAEVARAVGYEDAFYFSKQFKARFGTSPRDVRRG